MKENKYNNNKQSMDNGWVEWMLLWEIQSHYGHLLPTRYQTHIFIERMAEKKGRERQGEIGSEGKRHSNSKSCFKNKTLCNISSIDKLLLLTFINRTHTTETSWKKTTWKRKKIWFYKRYFLGALWTNWHNPNQQRKLFSIHFSFTNAGWHLYTNRTKTKL